MHQRQQLHSSMAAEIRKGVTGLTTRVKRRKAYGTSVSALVTEGCFVGMDVVTVDLEYEFRS